MYLLSCNSSIQTQSNGSEFSNLQKYNLSAIEVATSTILKLTLEANVVTPIQLPSLAKIQVLAVKSDQLIDLSLTASATQDVFTGLPCKYRLISIPEGRAFDHIKLVSTVNATVEVAVAGLFV